MRKLLLSIAGDKKRFTLEHQVFNSIGFIITLFSFFASSSNWMIQLHPVTVWMGYLGGLASGFIYYFSRFRRVFNNAIALTYVVLVMFFLSGIYYFNDGSSGTINYLIVMFLTIMLLIVPPRLQFLVFCLLYGNILVLLVLEYLHPEWLMAYDSRLVRIQDHVLTIFLSTLFTTIAVAVFRNSYIYEQERVSRQNVELLLLNKQIDFQKAELERKARELEQSIQLANERNHRIETLLKELHHRVKNNLQVISSLLALQYNRLGDELARQSLLSSRTRIEAMALIHKSLYQYEEASAVDIGDYLRSLADSVAASYGEASQIVQLEVDLEDRLIDIDFAVPLGLIVNELLSNACKHAFRDIGQPEVRVSFSKSPDGWYVLRVKDNGVGMRESSGEGSSASFGMKLVQTLVAQLDGSLEIKNENGTEFIIKIGFQHE